MMIGVPVNPMRAAFGSASIRLACSADPWERWASSTITRIESDSLSVPNASLPDSPSPPLLSMSRYFWIIAITTPGPGWLSSSFTSLALRATLIVSPVRRGGLAELVLQVGAVGDEHDLETTQFGVASHRPDEEHHRQALA